MKLITYSNTFSKNIIKLDKNIQINILNKIEDLSQNKDNLDIKKLSPKDLGIYRLRVGKYRIFFEYLDENIHLLNIDNRNKIYKVGF